MLMLMLGACSMIRPYGPPIPGSDAGHEPAQRPSPASVASPAPASAVADHAVAGTLGNDRPVRDPMATPARFRSRADSVAWAAGWRRARADKRLRVVVSLDARTLWLLVRDDTLRVAPVAIGTEERLVHGRNSWVFETPRGVRTVRAKAADPVWTPPLWHYVKEAKRHGVELAVIPANGRMALGHGERLEVRDSLVGRWSTARGWQPWPVNDEIIIGDTLYVPPIGTKNRMQHGQLGAFKLDTGDGYLIHGSRDPSSIGTAATHGCLRMAADDLAFVYARVPVGTPVYIL
jgi:lipoprotein-anchoring transpeptidase ErfK/SrfK